MPPPPLKICFFALACLLTRDVEKNNYVDIFSHFLRSSAITLSSQFLLVLDDSAEN